jgi:toxin CcdB
MAQFDVYPNPQQMARDRYPYVVNIQSPLLDGLPSRFVVPLSSVGAQAANLPKRLIPEIDVLGRKLTFMPHLAAPVPAHQLSKAVTNLEDRHFELVSAMDVVSSGV